MKSGTRAMNRKAVAQLLESNAAIAQAIASLFSPFVEAVIHDLKTNTIAHISNAFSPRRIGDPSELDETFAADAGVIGPYERTNFDGRRLKSISIVIRDDGEVAVGLLCINVDVTEFDSLRRTLQSFLGHFEPTTQVKAAFHDDWHERINRFVAAWTAERGTTVDRLEKGDRREIIQALYEIRAFEGHRAAAYVARLLNVSRATIYNELARLRSSAAA
jgi:D-arginine utilization repressor